MLREFRTLLLESYIEIDNLIRAEECLEEEMLHKKLQKILARIIDFMKEHEIVSEVKLQIIKKRE